VRASRVRTVQALSNLGFLSPALVGWTAAHHGHVTAFVAVVGLECALAVAAMVALRAYPVSVASRTPALTGPAEALATMLAHRLNGRIRSIETVIRRGAAEPSAVADEPIGGAGANAWSARSRGRLRHRPRPGHP
jgi:hypothetical protein